MVSLQERGWGPAARRARQAGERISKFKKKSKISWKFEDFGKLSVQPVLHGVAVEQQDGQRLRDSIAGICQEAQELLPTLTEDGHSLGVVVRLFGSRSFRDGEATVA